MPYRVDIFSPPPAALDLLVELGALDVEPAGAAIAAIFPDGVPVEQVAGTFAASSVTVSAALSRDNGSVWILSPRAVRIGSILIAPAEAAASPGTLRLADSVAFGTGHHPTTALCMEALEEFVSLECPGSVLDVGTGTGILALAALTLGVPRAAGIDLDAGSLEVAAENARLNHLSHRLHLRLGEPGSMEGTWPLVVANVLAAPLIEMAPHLVRRLASRGRLILSGIPSSLESEVRQPYQHLGLHHLASKTRAGWTSLIFQASW